MSEITEKSQPRDFQNDDALERGATTPADIFARRNALSLALMLTLLAWGGLIALLWWVI